MINGKIFDMGKLLMKTILCTAVLMIAAAESVHAEENTGEQSEPSYTIVDFSDNTEIGTYDNEYLLNLDYEAKLDEYDNLGIVKDGTVVRAEYASVIFHTDDACEFTVSYENVIDSQRNELNGCYGIDAAYIDTDDSGKVIFQISGVRGKTSIDNVDIVPMQQISRRLSMYYVQDGQIYHEIKTEMDDDLYSYIYCLGEAPGYLNEHEYYYSYDGHYFYEDGGFTVLIDDLKNDTHENAVNPDSPWYCYYQFVSHRTLTNVTFKEMNDALTGPMGIKGTIDTYQDNEQDGSDDTLTRSQYYGNLEAFWQYQYEYGANALMMLAVSVNESAFGRSALSFTKNNLFAHAAYDTQAEADANRYSGITNSVYAHARYYISGSYASPMKAQFHGSFFGNKSAGMNVKYSSDPYWGEKSASQYYQLDQMFGLNDFNSQVLAVRTVESDTDVYQYPDGSTILYKTGTMPDMAFTVIGEVSDENGDWYAVQCEATLNDEKKVDLDYLYDFRNDVGYIRKNAVQLVLNERRIPEKEYALVTFESDGGAFAGGEENVSYTIETGSDAVITGPEKAHSLFEKWDMDTGNIDADIVYTAEYRDVSGIEISSMPKTDYELNDRVDLKGGKVTVIFKDGSRETYDMTTSMLSGFDLTKAGDQQIAVTFAGCTVMYPISVSAEKDSMRAVIKEKIVNAIEKYRDTETLAEEEAEKIIALKKEIDSNVLPYLTQAQMRQFDKICWKAYQDRIKYVVDRNSYRLGVSGLCVSLPLGNSLEKDKYDADTYRIRITEGIEEEHAAAFADILESRNCRDMGAFTVTLLKNMEETEISDPLVYTIALPKHSEAGDVFTVMYYDKTDGDIELCYTRQTENTISFMSAHTGEFVLTARRTSNHYQGTDPVETFSHERSSKDLELMLAKYVGIAAGALILWLLIRLLIEYRSRKFAARRHEENTEKVIRDHTDLEVTQAIEILNTQVLSLQDIEKAAQEEDKS